MLAGLCCTSGLDDTSPSSHVVIVLVVENVAHEQNDRFAAEILPPVRGATRLRPDVTGLVHDRIGAVAGVFDDLAFGDVNNRRPIGVAVPGHDAARLDRELAESQLAFLDVGRLLLEVDGGEHCVGDALAGMGARHAHVGFGLAGGTFAGGGYRHAGERRARHYPGEGKASAERAATYNAIEHGRGLLCYAPAAARP